MERKFEKYLKKIILFDKNLQLKYISESKNHMVGLYIFFLVMFEFDFLFIFLVIESL